MGMRPPPAKKRQAPKKKGGKGQEPQASTPLDADIIADPEGEAHAALEEAEAAHEDVAEASEQVSECAEDREASEIEEDAVACGAADQGAPPPDSAGASAPCATHPSSPAPSSVPEPGTLATQTQQVSAESALPASVGAQPPAPPALACYKCGGVDHIGQECPLLPQEPDDHEDARSRGAGPHMHQLPFSVEERDAFGRPSRVQVDGTLFRVGSATPQGNNCLIDTLKRKCHGPRCAIACERRSRVDPRW